MEEQDIEKQLKESADKIKVDDFSARWNIIKDRIDAIEGNKAIVQQAETAAITSGSNKTVNSKNNRVLVAVVSCSVILLLALCITLGIILGNQNEKRYSNLKDLFLNNVTEIEFYNKIQESDIKLVDFTEYELSSFKLLLGEDKSVRGGTFEAYYDTLNFYMSITFYDPYVSSEFDIGPNHKQLNIGKVNVAYKTEFSEEIYSTSALAKSDSVTYEMSVTHSEDNFESIANKLFG